MDKQLEETIKDAQNQYADYLAEMKTTGHIQDLAFEMFLLLKDLVDECYSPETIKHCARNIISQVEGK